MCYNFSEQSELFHIALEILEDYSEIQHLLAFGEEVAQNLAINSSHIQSSPTGVKFILNKESHGLKLDFVYSPALTKEPFVVKKVFGVFDVKVQTPQEIIAKKLKFREKATIRDFIDYAIVKEKDKVLSRLKSQGIVDIDRYFDVIDKFDSLAKHIFDEELRWLMLKEMRVR